MPLFVVDHFGEYLCALEKASVDEVAQELGLIREGSLFFVPGIESLDNFKPQVTIQEIVLGENSAGLRKSLERTVLRYMSK